jgi:hypothetical protein
VNPTLPTPDAKTAFSFWNSKVLLTPVMFDLFTKLGQELAVHPRGIADFLDSLWR